MGLLEIVIVITTGPLFQQKDLLDLDPLSGTSNHDTVSAFWDSSVNSLSREKEPVCVSVYVRERQREILFLAKV